MDITGGARIRDRYGDVGPYEANFCSESAFINKTLYVDSSQPEDNKLVKAGPMHFYILMMRLRLNEAVVK